MAKNKYLLPFALVTSLFFLWAFLHNINSVLIPHLKKACELSDTQSSFIDIAVYLAYFLTAIPAGLAMQKYGYKRGIIIGLSLYAAGSFLVIPAASERSYLFFLFAFFVIACGAAFLETVANPYVSVLGDKETSEQRLNFAQSFNGVGAFIAPILGGKFILSGIEHTKAELAHMKAVGTLEGYLQSEANTVKLPYLVIGGVVVVLIIFFLFTYLPDVQGDEDNPNSHAITGFSIKVLRHKHLRWAALGEFCYVGSQVGVCSFFVRYAKYVAGIDEKDAAYLLGSIAMVGFMIGRFTGTFIMRYIKPARLLSIYALISILLLIVGVTAKGNAALYCVMATPFFMSIMFPTIFALGIKGLGDETKSAAPFLVMAIIGGAVAPLFMGIISDKTGSIQTAYVVPLICFIYILFFGLKGYKQITPKEVTSAAEVL